MRRLAHIAASASLLIAPRAFADHTINVDPHAFKVVERDSGPVNYYKVVDDPGGAFIHSEYEPAYDTTSLGYAVPDSMRHTFHKLSWRWRALALPTGGNECAKDKGDSAAVIYVTWKRGLKWYALKYVWSSVGPKGATCDHKGGPFRGQETVILETGGPLNQWVTESIDLDAEYRKHFENGDPKAEVPDFMGLGIMSDGDQTHSKSSADVGGFVLSEK